MSNSSNICFHTVENLVDLASWGDQWNRLTSATPYPASTCSYAWFRSIIEHIIPPNIQWKCLFAHSDRRLLAVVPLIESDLSKNRRDRRPTFTLLNDEISYVCDMLVASDAREEELDALASEIRGSLAGSKLVIARTPAGGATERIFGKPRSGLLRLRESMQSASYIDTSGDISAYRCNLGSITRNVRRGRRRLLAEIGNEPLVHIETQATELNLQNFMDLEAQGYKGRQGTAIRNFPNRIEFYRTLTKRLEQLGELEWHFLRVNDKLIAAHFAFQCGNSLVLSKICYDEAFRKCSPGSILMAEIIDRAFSDPRVDRIDLITDLPWHDTWKASKRNYFCWTIYPNNFASFLIFALHTVFLSGRTFLAQTRDRVKVRLQNSDE